MATKFHENCVITGAVDSFCLSCQIYLFSTEELSEHIETSTHKNALKSISYVEKYKDEFIRKVKMGYFCEVCNMMSQTLAKVGIHVSGAAHINNKMKRCLTKVNEGVIAYDVIFIPNQAWHGLSEGSCAVCNVDYDDEDDHINNKIHIINLIQSKLELRKDNVMYRMVEDSMISCLICNTTITSESKESHINDPEHLDNYLKCKENKKSLNTEVDFTLQKCSTRNVLLANNETKDEENLDTVHVKVQKIDTSNSKETGKVMSENTKTCIGKYNNTKNADNQEDDNEVLTPEESLKQAKEFAKQNYMKYKRNSTYCRLCDVRISSSLKMMKEHVLEASHKKKLNTKKEKINTTEFFNTTCMSEFIQAAMAAQNMFYNDLIINDNFCIDALSFNMMSQMAGRIRCHACEVSMQDGLRDIETHSITLKHVAKMQLTLVLTDFSTEFIREMRTGVYHCGFCNFIETGMERMRNHLRSTNHFEKRFLCQERLKIYLRNIQLSKP